MASIRILACAEVTSLQQPFACLDRHFPFIIGGGFRWLAQVDVEFEVRTRRTSEETRVSIFDQPTK